MQKPDRIEFREYPSLETERRTSEIQVTINEHLNHVRAFFEAGSAYQEQRQEIEDETLFPLLI